MVFDLFMHNDTAVLNQAPPSLRPTLTSACSLFTSSSAAFSSDAEAGDTARRLVGVTFDPGDVLLCDCTLEVPAAYQNAKTDIHDCIIVCVQIQVQYNIILYVYKYKYNTI